MTTTNPVIIQGGMGIGVSNWNLARTVARAGQLGVVSSVAIDAIFIRRLQNGDPNGDVRRALRAFPDQEMAQRFVARFFIEGGKAETAPYAMAGMIGEQIPKEREELLIVATFVEVWLAKEGHSGKVGINYLEKIQTPLLPSLYGALLAQVDVIIMGAGIPRYLPKVLDAFMERREVEAELAVLGPVNSGHARRFNPADFPTLAGVPLKRPEFYPIVASVVLASMLVKKSGRVDAIIIEGPTAGGHNAPPRGKPVFDDLGQPVYGPRDVVDLAAIRELGVPFYLAGSYGTPERLKEALAEGAAGIQVGSLFAFCRESGMMESIRQAAFEKLRNGTAVVHTDAQASPTGFPFKLLQLPGTHSDMAVTAARKRVCDLGYLREAYERPDGSLGWRCASEEEDAYVRKGGAQEDLEGRRCLCNCLLGNIGLGQVRKDGKPEAPIVTTGDDVATILRVLPEGATGYGAGDVLKFLLSGIA